MSMPKNVKLNASKIIILLTTVLTCVNSTFGQISNIYFNLQSGNVQSGKVSPTEKDKQSHNPTVPNTRLDIDSDKKFYLTIEKAIEMGLENNLELLANKQNVPILEHTLGATKGIYDFRFNTHFDYFLNTFPVNSTIIRSTVPKGVEPDINITEKFYTYNFDFFRRFSFGGLLKVDFTNQYLVTDQGTSTLGSEFRSKPSVTFSQPLLKNLLIDENRFKVKGLKKQIEIADQVIEKRKIDLVAQIESAYYDLAFAIKNQEVLQDSVNFAFAVVELNEAKFNVGQVPQVDLISAQSQLALRKEEAIIAQTLIAKAENQLKPLILASPLSVLWKYSLIPTNSIDLKYQSPDLETSINSALEKRPEIKQLALQGDLNQVAAIFFKDQCKPEFNVFSTFFTQNVIGQRNISRPPPEFIGNYFEGILGLYKFRNYVEGATFKFIKGNNTAKANLEKALLENTKLDLTKRKALQQIISEVTYALQAVEITAKNIELAQVIVLNAQIQLKAEKSRYEVGVSSNALVLERENMLTLAIGKEIKAKIDYLKAFSELKRVTASNLP